MPKIVNLAGQVFGNLVVLAKVPYTGVRSKYSLKWECRCRCGNLSYPRTNDLVSGKTTHCGCVRGTHNQSHTKEYNSWRHIKSRCTNPDNRYYPRYGGRGIKMCDRWLNSFENFLSDVGPAPDNSKAYSIERKDNNGDYEPSNCKWATYTDQANNRRSSHLVTYNGRTMTLADWCRELKIPYARTQARLNRQRRPVEEAFNVHSFK